MHVMATRMIVCISALSAGTHMNRCAIDKNPCEHNAHLGQTHLSVVHSGHKPKSIGAGIHTEPMVAFASSILTSHCMATNRSRVYLHCVDCSTG